MKSPRFQHVVVAGTFDHFHSGHQHLLKTAYLNSRFVSCGILENPEKKILSSQIQKFKSRQKTIRNFLQKNNLLLRTKTFPLSDLYGPTLKKTSIQAVVATHESFSGVQQINQRRKNFNLKPLACLLSNLIYTNDNRRLSSTLIRLGQTNPQGLSFIKSLPQKSLHLPPSQRKYFKKPIGRLFQGKSSTSWSTLKAKQAIQKENPPLIITVGDIATQSFAQHRLNFNLAVIDFKFRRKKLPSSFHQNILPKANITKAINHPSTLSIDLLRKLKALIPQTTLSSSLEVLQITGEEDLTVLPLILLSPLNALIFYGQPGQGVVRVKVTLKKKHQALRLLQKFSL